MDHRKNTPVIRGCPQTAGQIRIDLHCHSVYSGDSVLTVDTILRRGKELGLQGIAVTDHDRLLPEHVIRRYHPPGSPILLVPGCEITTLGGHLLVFGMDTIPPVRRPLAETIHHVRDRGGIPILAHPFRVNDGVGDERLAAFPDVLFEGMNGRSWMRYNMRALEKGYAAGRSMTGGSDAHDMAGIGRAWTVITGSGSRGDAGADDPMKGQIPDPTEELTLDRVLEALEKGQVEPGGFGLSTGGLVWSKATGTLRWAGGLMGRKGGPD